MPKRFGRGAERPASLDENQYFPLRDFNINSISLTCHNSIQKGFSALVLKQHSKGTLRYSRCYSFKSFMTHEPTLLIFLLGCKRLPIVFVISLILCQL